MIFKILFDSLHHSVCSLNMIKTWIMVNIFSGTKMGCEVSGGYRRSCARLDLPGASHNSSHSVRGE